VCLGYRESLFEVRMTLEEAIQVFDGIRQGEPEAIGIPICCGLPVVQNRQDGATRISCQVCHRTISQVAGQWIVSE
jgi:hypothetical protein